MKISSKNIKNGKKSHSYDYTFYEKNCLTEAIKIINLVVDDESKRLPVVKEKSWWKYLFNPTQFSDYTKVTPLHYFSVLKGHPLIKGGIEVIMPWHKEASLTVFDLFKSIQRFSRICPVIDKEWENDLLEIAQKKRGRVAKAFLDQLTQFYHQCQSDEKEMAFKSILYHIYLLSPLKDAKIVEGYCPHEKICDFTPLF